MEQEYVARRFAYRFGDRLPRPLRVIYYVVLTLTLIYWLYRLIALILGLIQRIGAFLFEKRNYYTLVLCLALCGIIVLLTAQFYFNLDPFGKFWDWVCSIWNGLFKR